MNLLNKYWIKLVVKLFWGASGCSQVISDRNTFQFFFNLEMVKEKRNLFSRENQEFYFSLNLIVLLKHSNENRQKDDEEKEEEK